MRLWVDLDSNALYLRLSEEPIVETEEVKPGLIVDFASGGRVVGIELLHIKEYLALKDLSSIPSG